MESGNHPTSPETNNSTFYVSAIEIRLGKESGKTIGSIKLCKNNQLLKDVEKTMHASDEHREEFEPSISVSLQDHISASVNYSTNWKRAKISIDIGLYDNECVREEKERGVTVRVYRKRARNVEVTITVHQEKPALVAITTQIIKACSRFRILIMGNTGVGKSSLIHKVFGVDSVKASQNRRGEALIEQEFASPRNERLVVHDSLGFEAGDEKNIEIVKGFVAERKKKPKVADQLHAIWLCLEIPYAGGRLLETGVEKFLERRKEILGEIPLVVVLTKVDLLNGQLEIDLAEGDTLENSKSKYMDKHCIRPLHNAAGNDVTYITVSTLDGYSTSLSDLLKATDKIMADYNVGEVPRIMATIAQRISIKEKIELSISIGKKKYWNTLLTSAVFRGRTLDECLKVIREDITQVWNFNDPDKCLMDDRITGYLLCDNPEGVTDGAASSNGASSVSELYKNLFESNDPILSVLPAVLKFACPPMMLYGVHQEAKKDVKILMPYIVDLICIMQIVFLLLVAPGDRVTLHATALAVSAHENSRRVVHRIVEEIDGQLGVHLRGRDFVLEKIEEWIWRFSITDDQIQELRQWLDTHPGLVPASSGPS